MLFVGFVVVQNVVTADQRPLTASIVAEESAVSRRRSVDDEIIYRVAQT
jgi:hypothetical protein